MQEILEGAGLLYDGVNDQAGKPFQVVHRLQFRSEDDGKGHVFGTEFLDQFQAGDPGHPLVRDQQIITFTIQRPPGGGAVGDGVNFLTGTNQHPGIQFAGVNVVIRHQNAQRVLFGKMEVFGIWFFGG